MAHPVTLARGPAPLVDERRHEAERKRRGKISVTTGKLREIGTSGPIDAGEDGPQRATRASDIGFGREDAICE
jgi:hypothetical protein